MQNEYIEKQIALIKENINDTEQMFSIIDRTYEDGLNDGMNDLLHTYSDGMNEKQITVFTSLLEMFINDCGLDRIEACNKAKELLTLINQ